MMRTTPCDKHLPGLLEEQWGSQLGLSRVSQKQSRDDEGEGRSYRLDHLGSRTWKTTVIITDFLFLLNAMGNHQQALSREKDPISVWDMLSLKGYVKHTGGRVQQVWDMNPQRAEDLGYICENHCHIACSGSHGCRQVCLRMLPSLMRRGRTWGHQQLKGGEKRKNLWRSLKNGQEREQNQERGSHQSNRQKFWRLIISDAAEKVK